MNGLKHFSESERNLGNEDRFRVFETPFENEFFVGYENFVDDDFDDLVWIARHIIPVETMVLDAPLANRVDVIFEANIPIIFDGSVNSSFFTDQNFVVFGTQTGLHSGTFTLSDSNKTVTFDPDKDFGIGELVSVTLSGALCLQEPYVFSFQVQSINGGGSYNESRFSPYAVGNNTGALVASDFNNDGFPDIAVTRGDFKVIVFQKGTGKKKFRKTGEFRVGGIPGSLTFGDFNRDGNMDLAIATADKDQASSDFISILLGNGDMTFQSPQLFAVGAGPNSIQSGDLNGDGNPDLAVNNHFDKNVSVLLGNGNGTFQAQKTFPVDGFPRSMVIGDFNNDGKLDIASASGDNTTSEPGSGPGKGSLLLGNGDGTFQNKKSFNPNSAPFHMATGDFNEDGILDIVVANEDDIGLSSKVITLVLGNGDGTFEKPTKLDVDQEPRAVVVGDFKHDGHQDIAVAGFNKNHVSLLYGDGKGKFKKQVLFNTGDGPNSIVSCDFNKDGNLDLATSNVRSQDITILFDPPGFFNVPDIYNLSQNYPNPFNPSTTIHYQVPEDGNLEIKIFNLFGQVVKTLVNEDQRGGHYFIQWDGTNDFGMPVASGVYWYIIQAQNFTNIKKMMFLK